MVFSFFRKKEPPTISPPAKRKPAKAGALPDPGAPVGHAPKIAVPQVKKPPVPGAAPAAAKKIPPKGPPKALANASPKKASFADSGASGLEVSDSSAELSGAAEEAAILYANNQVQPAIAVLLQGIGEKLGGHNRSLWLMLFDLYQLQGMQQEFDDLALDFVVKFERSPPPWRNQEKAKAAPKVMKPAAAGTANLSGKLTAACKPQLEQLVRTIESKNQARLDLSKIDGLTAEGSALLLATLQDLRKRNAALSLSGGDQLANVAKDALTDIDGNQARGNEALYLLLLELYQILDRHDEFDDLAVQYAVETEVSPPSWETTPNWRDEPHQPIDTDRSEAGDNGAAVSGSKFALSGEMAGSTEPQLRDLVDYAAARLGVEVDMTDLRRMDFVCCGMFLNILTSIRQAGKNVRLTGANEMVFALCRVMGVDQVATLVKSKHH